MKCSLAQLELLFKMNMNEMNVNASHIQEPVKRSSCHVSGANNNNKVKNIPHTRE